MASIGKLHIYDDSHSNILINRVENSEFNINTNKSVNKFALNMFRVEIVYEKIVCTGIQAPIEITPQVVSLITIIYIPRCLIFIKYCKITQRHLCSLFNDTS